MIDDQRAHHGAMRHAQADQTCDKHLNLFRRSEQQFTIAQKLQQLDGDNGRLMRESRENIGKLNQLEQRVVGRVLVLRIG